MSALPPLDQELLSKTKKNTEYLSLNGQEFDAKIVHIYDGDTMHVVFFAFGEYYRWNCRIQGVDTPELRTKNTFEKKIGYQVRDILRTLLLNKVVRIHCYDFDKYGRLLIDIYIPDQIPNEHNSKTLSAWLIDNSYAYAYHGGTKQSWGP